MPLKSYYKNNSSYSAVDLGPNEPIYYPVSQEPVYVKPVQTITVQLEPQEGQSVNMWSLSAKAYDGLKHLVASSSLAGLIIPSLFILGGVGLIYQQFSPSIAQQLKESAGYYNQGTASLVQEKYITDRLQYVSNPGADYFKSLTEAAFSQDQYKPDLESTKFSGTFYISIPSLGITRLPIAANVESGIKEAYNQVLNSALAHFRGTSLPFATNPHNIVVYGHSAGGSYNPQPNDVLAAFSFLSNLKVGDEIILEMEGVEYKYRMTHSKIVEPNDISIITGTPGKETLTLFTCYPPGNNSHRYVAIATPTN